MSIKIDTVVHIIHIVMTINEMIEIVYFVADTSIL